MRFAERENVKEILGRRGIDIPVVLVSAMVADDHGRQPDDVQLANMAVAQVETERHERGVDRADDGGVWIRHGIQELAAYSVLLFDIDQEQPPLLPGAVHRRVPVSLPLDASILRFGHWRLHRVETRKPGKAGRGISRNEYKVWRIRPDSRRGYGILTPLHWACWVTVLHPDGSR